MKGVSALNIETKLQMNIPTISMLNKTYIASPHQNGLRMKK